MISFEEAMAHVRAHRGPERTEAVPLARAIGRRLSGPVVAPFASPAFDSSAMDGYAVGSKAGPWTVRQLIAAGDVGTPLGAGDAARIFTGAPVPAGTFAVLAQEDARLQGDQLQAETQLQPGQHVRCAGEEFELGAELLPAGIRVTPPVLSLLASIGHAEVPVRKVPRVLVLATGSELLKPGAAPQAGRVYESNSQAVRSVLESFGCDVACLRVHDDAGATVEFIREHLPVVDLVISIGGVSVGDFDFVRGAMEATGFATVFQGVSIKPGKPVTFAVRHDGKAWFGLPGNPMSALVTMSLFVLSYLGEEMTFEPHPVARGIARSPGRTEFVPAVLGPGGLDLHPVVGSHAVAGLAGADGLARIESGMTEVLVGDELPFAPFPWRFRP
jgi:molybdopterin molybdotransferase